MDPGGRALAGEIRERGYAGGISQLKAWLAPLKKSEPKPLVRFETPPGKQMQADFTYVRRGRDPLLAFVATMGYSRASYVEFVASAGEDVATLCAGLREAFDCFGGVPEHVLFDNTKAVVIERDAYGEKVFTAGTANCTGSQRVAASSRASAGPIAPRPRARSSASILT